MASGETADIKMYIAVDGVNRRPMAKVTVSGDDEVKVARLEAMTMRKDAKPLITVTQNSGTPRTFYYWFIVQVLEVI